jgi:AmiR/NasT family two-component response regulator
MEYQGHQETGFDPVPTMEQVVERLTEMNGRLSDMARVMETRDVLGQAKGILMERYGISSDEAQALLIASSSGSGIRLGLVAANLVTNGHLPDNGPQ